MEEEARRLILREGQRIMERTKKLEKAVYPTRRKLTRGMESAKGKNLKALTWKCPKCGKVNRPERRLLVVLPVILCACGEESNVQFDFSLHKVELNDHFLIPIIRKQNPKDCSPCSMLALAEISLRANAILNGQVLEDCEPHLDRVDMLEKYNYLCDVCGIDKRFNQTAVETLLEVFSTIGIQSVSKEEDGDGSQTSKVNEVGFESEASNSKEENPKLYMLPFYSAVKKNFSAICRLLGDGYVIRTSFYAGRNFGKLKPGKIYKSPGSGRVRHAVVLIGAGRRGTTNYYHLLNSWGKNFCLRILKRGIRVGRTRFWSSRRVRNTEKALGGFGLLRESDIRARSVTFLRHEDDRKYYKRLLLKDIVPLGKTKEGPEAASIIPSWEAPQPSNTCSRNSELRKSGGTFLIDGPDQVQVSNEPSGQSAQVAHAICSPGDEVEPAPTTVTLSMAAIINKSTHRDVLPSPRDNSVGSGQEDGGSRDFEFKPHLNSQSKAFADCCGGYFGGQSSGSLLKEGNEQERKSGSRCKLIKKYEGSPINPGRSEALRVA